MGPHTGDPELTREERVRYLREGAEATDAEPLEIISL